MPRDRKPTLAQFLAGVVGSRPGTSQRAIARRAGVSPALLSRILSGARLQPSPATLRRLARAVSVEPSYLLFLAGVLEEEEWRRLDRSGAAAHEPTARGYSPGGLSASEWETVQLLRRVESADAREALLTLLRAIAERT